MSGKRRVVTVGQIARMIERRVSYFNGWSVSEKTMKEDCKDAATAILKTFECRLKRRAGGKGRDGR